MRTLLKTFKCGDLLPSDFNNFETDILVNYNKVYEKLYPLDTNTAELIYTIVRDTFCEAQVKYTMSEAFYKTFTRRLYNITPKYKFLWDKLNELYKLDSEALTSDNENATSEETGTENKTDNVNESGTIKDEGTSSKDSTKDGTKDTTNTGTIKDEGTKNNTTTIDGTKTTKDTGTIEDSENSTEKSELANIPAQVGLAMVDDYKNAQSDLTKTRENTRTLNTTKEEDNNETQTENGSDDNTRTLDTKEAQTNNETISESGTKNNTRTLDTSKERTIKGDNNLNKTNSKTTKANLFDRYQKLLAINDMHFKAIKDYFADMFMSLDDSYFIYEDYLA